MREAISYIDGVGRVVVISGVAHIDLVAVMPADGDGQPNQVKVVHRLATPLPQFVRMCAEMAGHLKRMEEKGIIKRQDAKPAS